MPTNKLTDHQCRTFNQPGRKLFDGGGLYLFCTARGSKSWRMAFRYNGVQKTVTFGLYPDLGLAAARKKRDEARKMLAEGETLATKPKSSMSLSKAYTEYWEGRHDVSERYKQDAMSAFERLIAPDLGNRPIKGITRDDLLPVLLKVDKAGNTAAAKKTRTYLSQVWEWAVELGKCQVNIPQTIKPGKAFSRHKTEHFKAVDLPEVPALWSRIDMESHRIAGAACKMLAYTWTRTSELRFMRYSEIDGDIWRIPAGKMKRRRDHLVPLSKQALALLEVLKQSKTDDLVFSSPRDNGRPISENTILFLIYEIGYRGRMTGHGMRTIASTWANENGYHADAIERQLSHAPDDDTRAAYNRAEYLPQRREMLQAFADWLDAGLAKN